MAKSPSYPAITEDYRRTHHFLEMLKPDIWYCDFAGKRESAKTERVDAWIDPDGYRRFIAGKKRAFENEVGDKVKFPWHQLCQEAALPWSIADEVATLKTVAELDDD